MTREIYYTQKARFIKYNLTLTMKGYPDNKTMYYFEFRTISDCELFIEEKLCESDNFYYQFRQRIDNSQNVLLTVLTDKEL